MTKAEIQATRTGAFPSFPSVSLRPLPSGFQDYEPGENKNINTVKTAGSVGRWVGYRVGCVLLGDS